MNLTDSKLDNNSVHIAYNAIIEFTKNFIKTKKRIAKYTNVVKQFNTTEKRSIDIYISELEVSYDELIIIVELYRQYHFASLAECISFFMESYLVECHMQKRNRKMKKII